MTREQRDAIRARAGIAPSAARTNIEIDRDGSPRWINIGPFLCFTRDDAARVQDVVAFVHNAPTDLRALLAEVERLTADPLPAAAWVREVERAAFSRGVAAMREAAAGVKHCCDSCSRTALQRKIRALPDPEDTK